MNFVTGEIIRPTENYILSCTLSLGDFLFNYFPGLWELDKILYYFIVSIKSWATRLNSVLFRFILCYTKNKVI